MMNREVAVAAILAQEVAIATAQETAMDVQEVAIRLDAHICNNSDSSK